MLKELSCLPARAFKHGYPLCCDSQTYASQSRKLVGLAHVEDFPDFKEFDHGYVLITRSGSIVAARHEGPIVATV